jgi:putative transposase
MTQNSFARAEWNCKYRVVSIPKCRRQTLYEQLRHHLGEGFRDLASGTSAINLAWVYGERKPSFVGQHGWARG